jgi:broad-specificity NMP kinase
VPRYLITGDSGSGKTTVADALAARGFYAYSTDDEPGVTRLEDGDGRPTEWPDPPVDWSKVAWNWQEGPLLDLLAAAETVFVAAVTSNQERYYHLFDAIFVLIVDEATTRHRLLSRTDNDYGKDPEELARNLRGHAAFQRELLAAPRAVAIDALRPVEAVVDDIIARTQATTAAP